MALVEYHRVHTPEVARAVAGVRVDQTMGMTERPALAAVPLDILETAVLVVKLKAAAVVLPVVQVPAVVAAAVVVEMDLKNIRPAVVVSVYWAKARMVPVERLQPAEYQAQVKAAPAARLVQTETTCLVPVVHMVVAVELVVALVETLAEVVL